VILIPPRSVGLLYSNATVGSAIANTTSETAFASAYTIPANSLKVGDVLRIKLWGVYSTAAVAPTITGKIKFGSTVMLNTGALTSVALVSNGGWFMDASFVVQAIGGSGSIDAQAYAEFSTAATTGLSVNVANTAPITVATNAAQAITATVTWSLASASDSITLRQMIVEKLAS
jgi:hypothetical protein